MAWIDNKITNIEQKKKNINQKVLRGEITQEEANRQLEQLNRQLQQARQQQGQQQEQQGQQPQQSQPQQQPGANMPTQSAITAGLTSHFYSQDKSGTAAGKRETADIAQKQAAQEQINAQKNAQIANRDWRAETQKTHLHEKATAASAAKSQLSSAAGNSAAALAGAQAAMQVTPDYNTNLQRSDEQRRRGVEQQREGTGYAQSAALQRGKANIVDYRTGAKQIQSIYNDFLSNSAYGNEDIDFRKQQTVKMLQDIRSEIEIEVRNGTMPKDEADALYYLIDSTIEKVNNGTADNVTVANTLAQLDGRGLGI